MVKAEDRPGVWEAWFTLEWLKEHAEDWNKRDGEFKRPTKEELKDA